MLGVENNALLTRVSPGTPWVRSCGITGSRSAVSMSCADAAYNSKQDIET